MTRRSHNGFIYPGDHEDKQAARLFLYKYAKAAPIQGHAVTLAGTDPDSEVHLMRDYLKWPAHKTWFIDKSMAPEVYQALRSIQVSWPDANVEQVNLRNLLPRLGAVGFANLDFMGAPLTDGNIQCLCELVPRLLPKAIVGFTWIRGREAIGYHVSSDRLWDLGEGYEGNERRWAGVIKAVNIISDNTVKLIDRWEYQSNHSPMSVAVFKKE